MRNIGSTKLDSDYRAMVQYCEHKSEGATARYTASQDDTYTWCLIKRRVNPPEIPKEDSEACMREAGIPDPGAAARQLSTQAWRNCLAAQTDRLDDGVSSAMDVARAIVGFCATEWRGLVESLWLLPEAKRMMASSVDRYAVEEGARAVLMGRKDRQSRKK